MHDRACGQQIRPIDLARVRGLGAVLRLQRRAYRREARQIRYPGIPALRDTRRTLRALQRGGERFYGLFEGARVRGVISVRERGRRLEICRLVVEPRCWRRGIGRRLLAHVERTSGGVESLEVSAAAANAAALALYGAFGFSEFSRRRTPDGLELVSLRKELQTP